MDAIVSDLVRRLAAFWRAIVGSSTAEPTPSTRALPAYAALARYLGSSADLDPRLRLLVTQLAAERSRCRWCIDKGRHVWREAHLPVDLLRALVQFETSPLFSSPERAALRFADALTRFTESAGDGMLLEPLAAVRAHLSEPEVAALTAAVAELHFFNPITGVLGAEAERRIPSQRTRPPWGAPIGTSVRSFWL
jgi:alkylhydroperoxidase family enzyme